MDTGHHILQDLLISSRTNCVVKIALRHRKNPLVTAVESVQGNRIILRSTSLYGYPIKRRVILLGDVVYVTRYKTSFDNPLFERVRFTWDHLSALRHPSGGTALGQAGR